MSETLQEMLAPIPQDRGEVEITAKDLKNGLAGGVDDRMKETKVIVVTFTYGQRPAVEFQGFWNGKLVHNAMSAISRAYRLTRHKNIRANAGAQVARATTKQEVGDVKGV